ncbi:hypothetical protein [Psychrobacter sp. DAB_AL32B]|uniref:hypothetical protein n=1 Tax=Psychrobacter sp. DAB_AL32B TaxID=1028414 RepID=UPI000B8020BD|nr:hypothetical protein [Psychrobacter sp. DAB_AL32B]OXL28313.1 hypothetical protein CAN34_01000 [Psychrobacter sp. DAB_AL32B]
MYLFNNKNIPLFFVGIFITPLTSVAQTTNEQDYENYRDSIPVVQLKMISRSKDEKNGPLGQTHIVEHISYTDKLNKELTDNKVPFQYLTYEYGDGKFDTYPFELVNEVLPTIEGINPDYDRRYDKAFQKMIFKLFSPIDLTKKEIYAMGSQREGVYIQDINTNKKYVFNKICFDSKCALGQVFYIFNPRNYDMTGMLYDGCSFIRDNITGSDMRTKKLLEKYIASQNALDYSYAPEACRKRSSIAKGE